MRSITDFQAAAPPLAPIARASSFVEVRPGVLIHVARAGRGRPCIFLHGTAEAGFVWSEIADALSNEYETIIVDLTGHGESGWSADQTYTLDAYVRDVSRVLEILQFKQFTIVGHSLGGHVAAKLAGRFLLETRAIILVDTAYLHPPRTPLQAPRKKASRTKYKSPADYALEVLRTRPLVSREYLVRMAVGNLEQEPGGTFVQRWDPAVLTCSLELGSEDTWLSSLSSIRAETLILRAAGSALLTQDMAKNMARTIPKSCLQTIEGSGHNILADNPAGLLAAVTAFLSVQPSVIAN